MKYYRRRLVYCRRFLFHRAETHNLGMWEPSLNKRLIAPFAQLEKAFCVSGRSIFDTCIFSTHFYSKGSLSYLFGNSCIILSP